MVVSEPVQFHSSPMAAAKGSSSSLSRNKLSNCITNGFLFLVGALIAFLLVWSLSNFVNPTSLQIEPELGSALTDRDATLAARVPAARDCSDVAGLGPDLTHDPPEKTFYDDPTLTYTMERTVKKWDEKRRQWLKLHPTFGKERVLVVTGSQPKPCKNPIGDHLLLRFFKNKVDYCRIHGYDLFYNNVLLQPKMYSFWAKLPVVKAAMLAHPEAEWIWWVDSDALFTDMEFKLPLGRYRGHNLVAHGWAKMVYEAKSWTSVNAGVFLIRNCQWAMDFMEEWAAMGPQSPDFEKWGKLQQETFKDKLFPASDDQAALIYLLYQDRTKWAPKVYLEGAYYFEGYWLDIVGTLDNITSRYTELEWEDRTLRRRHAEKVTECYAAHKEAYVSEWGGGRGSWRRPPVTHFTGCQPCSGEHNRMYSGESCWDGMVKALNFADNQVLRKYGFMHPDLLDSATVTPVPFDSPV